MKFIFRDEDNDIFTSSLWWTDQVLRVGELGSFWGYTTFRTWEPTDSRAQHITQYQEIKWEDVNGDGLINLMTKKS